MTPDERTALIERVATKLQWEQCHTGSQTFYEFMPETEPCCIVAGVDYVTAHGTEVLKQWLRDAGHRYHITWDGECHRAHIWTPYRLVVYGATESEALLLTIDQLPTEVTV